MPTVAPTRNLDTLRACAVSIVFAGHLLHTLGYIPRWVVMAAHWGVVAFFVHTSLVLMLSMEKLRRTIDSGFVLRFYVRRAFRIYPLSIACVLLVAAFHIPRDAWGGRVVTGPRVIIANLMLAQNLARTSSIIAPLWSLPFEIQMYAVLPFLYLFLERRGWRWAAGAWAGALVLALSPAARLTGYFPCFLSGVLAYALLRTRARAPLPWFVWPAAMAAAAVLFSTTTTDGGPGNWFVSLALGLAIPLCQDMPAGWLAMVANQIAKYSYGIYLSHLPIMWLCFVRLAHWPPSGRFALFTVLAVLVPVACFHLLEEPLIRVGARLAAPRPKSAATVPA